jgi:hypothetical protein
VRGPLALPLPRERTVWHERWRAPAAHRAACERALLRHGLLVRRGGPYDRWDLELRAGALGCARVLLAVEEHGQGRQLVRARLRPCGSRPALAGALACAAAAVGLTALGAWPLAGATLLTGAALALWVLRDTMAATGAMLRALAAPPPRELAGLLAPAPVPRAELQAVAAGDER